METREIFSKRIRELRNGHDVSQMQLANALGLTQNAIGMMERGYRGTTIDKIVLLARYFHVSADYLLGITDDPAWRGAPPEEES
ncbi:MAG: helix-turn-helix transcriptional regulator [Oscillibacter sp.]|nr:helix-turn-helix transcriptional regulator [Oscillibacter sp.]